MRNAKAMTNTTYTLNTQKSISVSEVLCVTKIRKDRIGRENFGIKVKSMDTREIEWVNCYNIDLHSQIDFGDVIRHWFEGRYEVVGLTGMTALDYARDEFQKIKTKKLSDCDPSH